jgi:hypothetical protein
VNSEPVALAFSEPFVSRWVFDVEILARLIRATSLTADTAIYEYPLIEWHDVAGSKVRFRDFWLALRDLTRIYFRYHRH